jgi:Zn ribbon nucleic-acid-binding protein
MRIVSPACTMDGGIFAWSDPPYHFLKCVSCTYSMRWDNSGDWDSDTHEEWVSLFRGLHDTASLNLNANLN